MEGLSRKRALSPAASSSSDSDVVFLKEVPLAGPRGEAPVKMEEDLSLREKDLEARRKATEEFVKSVTAQEEAEKKKKDESTSTSRMKLRRVKDKPKDVAPKPKDVAPKPKDVAPKPKDVAPKRGATQVPKKKAKQDEVGQQDQYAGMISKFQKLVSSAGKGEPKLREVDELLITNVRKMKDELNASSGLCEDVPAQNALLQCLGKLETLKTSENLSLKTPVGLIG